MAATTSRAAIALIATLAVTPQLRAQAGAAPPTQHRDVDALIHQALAVNPRIRAAQAGVDAARARIAPAGTRPDPMLGIGIANLPVRECSTRGQQHEQQCTDQQGEPDLERHAAAFWS